MGAVEAEGAPCRNDSLRTISGEEECHGQAVPRIGIVGLDPDEEAVDRLSIAGEPDIEEQACEVGQFVGGEVGGLFLEAAEILTEQASCLGGGIAPDEQIAQTPTDLGMGRVELQDGAESGDGIVGALLAGGEVGEEEVCLGVVALDFEHAPELLARLGESIHIDEEAAEVEERVDVAGIVAEFAEEELTGSLGASGFGVRVGEACMDALEAGIERCGLAEAVDGPLVLAPVEERFGDVGVRRGMIAGDLEGLVEGNLGLIVAGEAGEGLDAVDERLDPVRGEALSGIEPLEGAIGIFGTERVGGDGDEGEFVGGLELVGIAEGADRLGEPAGGLEGQTKVEMPLRPIWVEGEGFAEFAFGIIPSPGFVQLVGSLDMTLCLRPVVHHAPRSAGDKPDARIISLIGASVRISA